MQIRRRRPLVAALAIAVALAAAGCGGDTGDPAGSTGGQSPPGDAADAPDDAAGGTTMRVQRVAEAKASETGERLHVVGLLIDDGSGWRLCEHVLESHPPQCGGETLVVDGLDPAEVPLEESDGVRWQTEATIVGEVDGDTLTVTGSPASS